MSMEERRTQAVPTLRHTPKCECCRAADKLQAPRAGTGRRRSKETCLIMSQRSRQDSGMRPTAPPISFHLRPRSLTSASSCASSSGVHLPCSSEGARQCMPKGRARQLGQPCSRCAAHSTAIPTHRITSNPPTQPPTIIRPKHLVVSLVKHPGAGGPHRLECAMRQRGSDLRRHRPRRGQSQRRSVGRVNGGQAAMCGAGNLGGCKATSQTVRLSASPTSTHTQRPW